MHEKTTIALASLFIAPLIMAAEGSFVTKAFVSAHSWDLKAGLQRIATLPIDANDSRILFTDEHDGWMHSMDKLWHSKDSGKTWGAISLPNRVDPAGLGLRHAHFFNDKTGWIWLERNLFRTLDGGKSWMKLPSFPISDELQGEIDSVWFLPDLQVGWAGGGLFRLSSPDALTANPNNAVNVDPTGRVSLLHAILYQTNDGGITWHQQDVPFNGAYRVLATRFHDRNKGFVCTERQTFFTVNGGSHWEESKFRNTVKGFAECDGVIKESFFLNGLHGWISYDDGYLFESVDGGRTWDFLRKDRYIDYFWQLCFVSPVVGWGIKEFGSLYRTEDGGKTWSRIPLDELVRSISFVDGQGGWINTERSIYRIKIP